MKFSFSPSSTNLEKVEEGTQLLLGDIRSEKELEIQVEFQENTPLTGRYIIRRIPGTRKVNLYTFQKME